MKNACLIMVLALSLFTVQACAKYEESRPVVVSLKGGALSLSASESAVYDSNSFDLQILYRSNKNEAWTANSVIYDSVWILDGEAKAAPLMMREICGTMDARPGMELLSNLTLSIPKTIVSFIGKVPATDAVAEAIREANTKVDTERGLAEIPFEKGMKVSSYKTIPVKWVKISFHYTEDGKAMFFERELEVK